MKDLIEREIILDALDEIESEVADGDGFQYEKWRRYFCELPPAQPEIIHCRDCKHHHYESKDIPYCDRIDYGYGWKDDDFCSRAERRTDEGD